MTVFNAITLFGGVALFLYGMNVMGGGLEKLAGGKAQVVLQKMTSSIVMGVLLGAVITGLIQSSAATTIIVIGLVNSGIMKFSQAIGVVMGANIGTTVTGQIIRLSDISGDNFLLQMFKPSTLAPAAAIIGIVLYMFFKSAKLRNVGQILLGFGTLFAGMFSMETSVAPLRESEMFIRLFTSLENPFLGVLAGAVVTIAIQSSSASVGMLQALTATGVVTWGSAIPIIFGQNIGTTVTSVVVSAGASRGARRVAASHVYFNLIGTALFMAVLYGWKALFGLPFWNDTMNMGDVANFHTLFNVITTLIFIPFHKVLVRLSEWTVPDKPGDDHPELEPVVLDSRLYTSPSVAIGQARKAVQQMAEVGRMNQQDAIRLMLTNDAEGLQLAQQREDVIDKLDVSITNYLVGMAELELSEYESREVTNLLTFVTEFERIGDYAINVVERSGEVYDKGISFSDDAKNELEVLDEAIGEIFDLAIEAFTHDDLAAAARVEPLEETVDLICETLRERHIARLKAGVCSIEGGIIFLEVLTNYERISDHCSNIAARLISVEEDEMDPHALRRSLHAGEHAGYNELAKEYREKYHDLIVEKTPDAGVDPAPLLQSPAAADVAHALDGE